MDDIPFNQLHILHQPHIIYATLNYNKTLQRHLVASKDCVSGECLLIEPSLLCCADDIDSCIQCTTINHNTINCPILRNLHSVKLLRDVQQLQYSLCKLEYIDTIDRASQLLLILLDCQLHSSVDSELMKCVLQLNCTTLDKYSQTVEHIMKHKFVKQNKLIPRWLTQPILAKLISILNNNTHEYNDINGTALTVYGSMFSHSCQPNCSFNGNDGKLYVYAISEIKCGDTLYIDYDSTQLYQPTINRQISLLQTKQFLCQCTRCSSFDLVRSFVCSKCDSGVVHPIDSLPIDYQALCHDMAALNTAIKQYKSSVDVIYQCNKCQCVVSTIDKSELVQTELQAEALLCIDDDTGEFNDDTNIHSDDIDVDQLHQNVQTFLQQNKIHYTHYLLFNANHCIARTYSKLGTHIKQVIEIYENLLQCINLVYCNIHDEKCILLDELAQVYVVDGQISRASECWSHAYQLSIILNGQDSTTTIQYKHLAQHTPINKAKLLLAYNY